ncbi:hypothetical protein AURDEDRAFT_127324 [Auricularia subglabra TFB-10046 SS5]|nr:hypothetical protein AURDEDRAFT_127324 [Auricularia subglabra TFB-10046 SS5]
MSTLPNKPSLTDGEVQAAQSIFRSALSGSIKSTAVATSANAPPVAAHAHSAPADGAKRPEARTAAASAPAPEDVSIPRVSGLSSVKVGVTASMRDIVERDAESKAQQDAVEALLRAIYKMGQRGHELIDDLRKETQKSFGSVFSTVFEDFMRLDDRTVPRLIQMLDDLVELRGHQDDLAKELRLNIITAINSLGNTLYPNLQSLDQNGRLHVISVNELTRTIQDGHAAILNAIPAPVYYPVDNEKVLEAIDNVRRDSNKTLELVLAAHALVDSLRDELTRAGIIGETRPRRSARISAAAHEQSALYQPNKLRKIRIRIPPRGCKQSAQRNLERDELDSTDEEAPTRRATVSQFVQFS